jgi:hypothetical protein
MEKVQEERNQQYNRKESLQDLETHKLSFIIKDIL